VRYWRAYVSFLNTSTVLKWSSVCPADFSPKPASLVWLVPEPFTYLWAEAHLRWPKGEPGTCLFCACDFSSVFSVMKLQSHKHWWDWLHTHRLVLGMWLGRLMFQDASDSQHGSFKAAVPELHGCGDFWASKILCYKIPRILVGHCHCPVWHSGKL